VISCTILYFLPQVFVSFRPHVPLLRLPTWFYSHGIYSLLRPKATCCERARKHVHRFVFLQHLRILRQRERCEEYNECGVNKKHSSVAYHHCRWSVAAGIITLAHISTHENIADCFTKRLPANTSNYLFGNWTY
jgi:hypothetical protein